MSNSESHRYYANAIGVVAFFAFVTFGVRACCNHAIESEKTKQVEIIYNCKKQK
jgi:hypothetical protein